MGSSATEWDILRGCLELDKHNPAQLVVVVMAYRVLQLEKEVGTVVVACREQM
jgi:hypothetical protein